MIGTTLPTEEAGVVGVIDPDNHSTGTQTSAWIATTAVIASAARCGPRRMAANAPPTKWTLVPPGIGRFNICAAKMAAAVTPRSGARGPSSAPAERRAAIARVTRDARAAIAATQRSRYPSRTCIDRCG